MLSFGTFQIVIVTSFFKRPSSIWNSIPKYPKKILHCYSQDLPGEPAIIMELMQVKFVLFLQFLSYLCHLLETFEPLVSWMMSKVQEELNYIFSRCQDPLLLYMGKCRNCPGQISLWAILTRIFVMFDTHILWNNKTQFMPVTPSLSLTDKLLCHNGRGNLSQTVQIHGKVATSLSKLGAAEQQNRSSPQNT